MSQRQIILDTETTGLYPESGDRLVEFAGLEMINRQMTDSTFIYMSTPNAICRRKRRRCMV